MPNYFVESDPSEIILNTGNARVIADTALNYIAIDTGASSTNDIYNGKIVEIIGGTGKNQARYIVDYNGTTKVASIAGSWAVKPDASSVYRIVERTLIAEGEVPTPSVLNRPYFSLIDNDLNLENVIQFLARGTMLKTNSNTKFLAHFKGNGKDEISGFLPEAPQEQYNEALYTDDNIFFGSIWPQNSDTVNLIGQLMPTVDPSLHNTSGWVISKGANISVDMATGTSGVRISTLGREAVSNYGTLTFTTPKFSISGLTGKISQALYYDNRVTFHEEGVSITYGIKVYNAASALIATYSRTNSTLTNSAGRFEINNDTIPVGANSAEAFIAVTYAASASLDITLRNFIVVNKPYVGTFISTTRNTPIDAVYTNLIGSPTTFSIFCWIKPRQLVFENQTADFGPLFIERSGIDTVGIVNTAAQRGNKSLSLTRVDTTGAITLSTPIIFGGNWDTYIPILLRSNASAGITEFCLIDTNGTLHKTSLPYVPSQTSYSLKLGYSDRYPTRFDCPLTEVRYDAEWWNDLEFRIAALAAHPFSKPMLAAAADDFAIGTNPNLIKNPDGKLGTAFWATTANFDAEYSDKVGYCLKYSRAATATDTYIPQTVKPSVTSGETITYRANIGSYNVTNAYGLYIRFYNGASPGAAYYKYVNTGASDSIQELMVTTPANATNIEFGLIVSAGIISTGGYIRWTQIKAERSAVSSDYTTESTPAYAVYAP